MTKRTVKHPFEFFGPSPYRVVRVQEVVHVVPGMYARAGSTCDVCGTCIRWVYTIKAGDGTEFRTGSDCAQKCGMSAAELREARRSFIRERTSEASRAARARAQAARAQAEAEERAANGGLTKAERREAEALGRDAARRWLETERLVEARHMGEIGKRLRGLELRVDYVASFEGYYGLTRIYGMRDRAGNALVWKTGGSLGLDKPGHIPSWHPATIKEHKKPRWSAWVICDATVKAHSEYKGLRQTELARVKVRSMGELEPVNETRFLEAR